jgi:hypothetical protein
MNEPDWTTHITAGAAWRRFGIMVIFVPILACVGFFIAFTALFQFFNVLAQGEPNPHLGRNGRDLGRYASDIIDFLTYNSEKRPFPFAEDEDGEKVKTPASEGTSPKKATPRKKTTTRKKTGTTRKKTTRKSTASRKKTTTQQTSESHTSEPAPAQPDAGKASESE